MKEFENLDDVALLDALAYYTARYTKMIADGASREDSMSCREIIQSLQLEIECRKKSQQNGFTQTRMNPPQ